MLLITKCRAEILVKIASDHLTAGFCSSDMCYKYESSLGAEDRVTAERERALILLSDKLDIL